MRYQHQGKLETFENRVIELRADHARTTSAHIPFFPRRVFAQSSDAYAELEQAGRRNQFTPPLGKDLKRQNIINLPVNDDKYFKKEYENLISPTVISEVSHQGQGKLTERLYFSRPEIKDAAFNVLGDLGLTSILPTEQGTIDLAFEHAMRERQLYLAMALIEAAQEGVTINLVADQYVSNVVSKKEAA